MSKMSKNDVWDVLEWEGVEYFLREVNPADMPDDSGRTRLIAVQRAYDGLREYFNECEEQYDA